MSCSLIPSVTLYGTTQITTTGYIWSTHTATITGSPYITLDGSDLVTITPTSESLSSTQVPGQTVVTSVVPQQTLYYPCSQDTSQATSSAAAVDHAAQQAAPTSNNGGSMTAAAFSASAVSAQVSAAATSLAQTSSGSAAAAQQVPAGSSAAVGASVTGSSSGVSQAVVSAGISTSLSGGVGGASGTVTPQLVNPSQSSTSGITVAAVSSSHPSAASGNGTDAASSGGTTSHSHSGAIAGGVAGGVLALVMLCVGLGWVRRRMDRDKDEDWEARTLDSREDYWERRFRQLDAEVGGEGIESDSEKVVGAGPTDAGAGATGPTPLESKKIRLTLDLASDGLSLDRPPSRLSAISTFFARSFPTPQVTPGTKSKHKSRKSIRPRPRSSRSSSSQSHRQSVRSHFSSPLSRNGDGVSTEDTTIAPVPPLPVPVPIPIPLPHPVAYTYDRSADPSPSLECDDNDVSEELRDSDHADLRRTSDFFSPTLGRLSLHNVFRSAVSPPWARDLIDSLSDSGATQGSEDEFASAQSRVGGEWPRGSESESSRGRVGSDGSDSPDASHIEETEDVGSVGPIGPIVMSNPRDMPTRSLTHPGTNPITAATAAPPATHSESDPVRISRSSSSSDSFVASRRSRAYGRPGLFRNFKTYLSPIAASPTSAARSQHASRTLSTLSGLSGFSTSTSATATATATASRDGNDAGQSGMIGTGVARTIYPAYPAQTISDRSQVAPVAPAPPAHSAYSAHSTRLTQGNREREQQRERSDLNHGLDPSLKNRRDARRPPGLALSREATTPSLWLEEALNPSRTGGTNSSANTIPTTSKALGLGLSPDTDTGASAYGGLEEVGL
ncbi:hypothetical protein JCM24511_05891 [Saitozyma sp. JCM 24511]|nr:hypothetical protein JCM24511_05891 [Saitozyma sp. JCM 24511]